MKKVFTLAMAMLALSSVVEAKIYNVTKKSEYSAAWTAAGVAEGQKDTILISATDMTGQSLCSDVNTKAGCVYFIGVTDADGNLPQVRNAGSIRTTPDTLTTFSVIFEKIHFCGTSAGDNLFVIEDNSKNLPAEYPINFDTIAFRDCNIEMYRWGLRSRITLNGKINYLEFVGNTVHKEGGNAGELMIFHHRINYVNISNNTFYNFNNNGKGIYWANRLTADDDVTAFEFYFENNNVVCGMGTQTLFDFGNYVSANSQAYIDNNFFYYPDWTAKYMTALDTTVTMDVRMDTISYWSDGTPRTAKHKVDSVMNVAENKTIAKIDTTLQADNSYKYDTTYNIAYDTTYTYVYDTLGTQTVTVKMPTLLKGRNLFVYAEGNVIRGYNDWLNGISVDKDGEGKWQNFDGKIDYEVSADKTTASVKHISGSVNGIQNNYTPEDLGFSSSSWTLPEDGDFSLWKQDAAGTYTKGAELSYVPFEIGADYWYTDVVKQKCSFSATLEGGSKSATLTVTPLKSQYFTGETVKLVVDLKGLNTFKGWSDGSMELERSIELTGDLALVATVEEDSYVAVWDLSDYSTKGYKNVTALNDLAGIAPNYTKVDGTFNVQYMEADDVNRVKSVNKVTYDTTWVDDTKAEIQAITADTTWNENYMEMRSSKCELNPKPCFAVKTDLAEYQAKQGHHMLVTLTTKGLNNVVISALVGTDGYTSKKIKVDYSTDCKNWTNFGFGTIGAGQDWYPIEALLPSDQEVVYVRFYGDPDASESEHLFPYDNDEGVYLTLDDVVYEFWFLTNIKIVADADLTGISSVESVKAATAKAYDLNGRRVSAAKSGLCIMNGKVIMVK